MFCFNFLCAAFLIADSIYPVSFCFAESTTKHHGQISLRQCKHEKEEEGMRSIEIKPVQNPKDCTHSLFPRSVNGRRANDWEARRGRQRRDASINHSETSERKSNPGISQICVSWLTRNLNQLQRTFTGHNKHAYDPTALLECMLAAVEKSLPSVVSGLVTAPVKSLFRKVSGFFGGQPAAEPISPEILESFIKEATPCFEYFKRDKDGKLILEEDFATTEAAEAIKLRPMGALAVGATEAVAENVSVTYDRRRRPQYNINHPGLATGLGLAAFKSTRVGQIAANPIVEGGNWLSRSISQRIMGGGASTARGPAPSNQAPFNQTPANQAPSKLMNLLQCVYDAAAASFSLSDVAGQTFGALRSRLGSFLKGDEAQGEERNEAATQPTGDLTNIVTPNMLKTFVKKATPCFGLFKHNEEGELVLDQEFASKAAIEAIRLTPTGALAFGSVEAIRDNVRVINDRNGNPQYEIDYSGLAAGLGKAFIDATKFGRLVRFGSQLASSLVNREK